MTVGAYGQLHSTSFGTSTAFYASFSLTQTGPRVIIPLASQTVIYATSGSPKSTTKGPTSVASVPEHAEPFTVSVFSKIYGSAPNIYSPSQEIMSGGCAQFYSVVTAFSVLVGRGALLCLSVIGIYGVTGISAVCVDSLLSFRGWGDPSRRPSLLGKTLGSWRNAALVKAHFKCGKAAISSCY